MLKRLMARVFRSEPQQNQLSSQLQDYHSGVVTVFKISNGFVLQVTNPNTGQAPEFVYCADYRSIADFFVALAAREKLGVQSSLFD